MAYTREQQRMIALALRLSARQPQKVRRALLEAMAVESNFRNLNYGHSTSEGILQQRPDQGWGPESESAATDIQQFLQRASRAYAGGFRGTAGQLAQAVQRSAFPGRYDQRRAEVNRLLGRTSAAGVPQVNDSTPDFPDPSMDERDARKGFLNAIMSNEQNLVPSIMALKNARESGQPLEWKWEGGDEEDFDATPGNAAWGGSQSVASSLIEGLGLTATSEKRDRKMTTSGNPSDHWTGSKNAYAYDLGGSVAKMDNSAVRLARSLGISYRKGQPLVATINRNGYRIQVLYRTNVGGNHFDHIHVGVRRS